MQETCLFIRRFSSHATVLSALMAALKYPLKTWHWPGSRKLVNPPKAFDYCPISQPTGGLTALLGLTTEVGMIETELVSSAITMIGSVV